MAQTLAVGRWRFGFWRGWVVAWAFCIGSMGGAKAQSIHLAVPAVGTSGVLEVLCSETRPVVSGYYVLLQSSGLEKGAPRLPTGQHFTNVVDIEAVSTSGATKLRHLNLTEEAGFYEVLALPPNYNFSLATDPNLQSFLVQDTDGDGIPNQFEIEHGLSSTFAGDAWQVPAGDNRRWLDIYSDDLYLSALPEAYFRQVSTTVVAGAPTVSLDVGFSKTFSGKLFYTLSGTAIPATSGTNGDYQVPSGSVGVPKATSATITIRLLPSTGVALTDRSLVVSLSETNILRARSYTVDPKGLGHSEHTIRILPSSQGVYLGTLSITNGLQVDVQSLKMAVRPATSGSSIALFDSTGSLLLGDNFTVPVTADTNGFQLTGGSTTILTNSPLGRNLSVAMAFGSTTTNDNSFHVPVTMTITGLTASGRAYSGQGSLDLVRVQ